MGYTSGFDPVQQMWDRDRKIARDNFGRKRKSSGFIYLPGSKLREAEGRFTMRSCLQDSVINSAPRIVKYINELELYIQCPPIRVKYKKITDIESNSCVRSAMKVTPVIRIEIEDWGAASILRRFNGGVYICICSVQYDEYMCKTTYAFVYDSHFKPLHQ